MLWLFGGMCKSPRAERSNLPTIKDLTTGVIYEGNEGSRWVVEESLTSSNEINVKLVLLKVEEQLIPETR